MFREMIELLEVLCIKQGISYCIFVDHNETTYSQTPWLTPPFTIYYLRHFRVFNIAIDVESRRDGRCRQDMEALLPRDLA